MSEFVTCVHDQYIDEELFGNEDQINADVADNYNSTDFITTTDAGEVAVEVNDEYIDSDRNKVNVSGSM